MSSLLKCTYSFAFLLLIVLDAYLIKCVYYIVLCVIGILINSFVYLNYVLCSWCQWIWKNKLFSWWVPDFGYFVFICWLMIFCWKETDSKTSFLVLKMSIFIAIRFVLSDLFQNLRSEDRHALLHVCFATYFVHCLEIMLSLCFNEFYVSLLSRKVLDTKYYLHLWTLCLTILTIVFR